MNRLRNATSPYLLQHADNPVDWYEWGPEAFEAARAADKPILLSVGYSACHWCHVMAHESFEDPATAAIMNRDFINIKVDREERPDVDDIYMTATQIFSQGRGGWPMTVFLTPDGRPFHAGTYYPNREGLGMPSFRQIMAGVIDAYRNRRPQVERVASEVAAGLQRTELRIGDQAGGAALSPDLLEAAYRAAIRDFDPVNGGLHRGQPKFPSPMNYEFVLGMAVYHRDPSARARAAEVVRFSLLKMARGGIYDQIGGGFHRYSVDRFWTVPHFEKMLYDNAQISRLYVHAWQATGDPFFRTIATEIYDYILREMTAPEGGFFSATDADSEGEEGKFFVWTPAELQKLLTEDEYRAATVYWDVTEGGNFEGHTILTVPAAPEQVALGLGIDVPTLMDLIRSAKDKLYAARTHRVPPGLDDKILTAWNGMMLASLAEAARAFNRPDYAAAARRNADFLLATMKRGDRVLRSHSHKSGQTHLNGYLEDYANLIDGLIQLYQTTAEPRYFVEAQQLADSVLRHFRAEDGGFYDTSDDHEKLIARPRNLQDNATPSGNSMMAKVLIQLAAYTGNLAYQGVAAGVLEALVNAMQQYPLGFGEALNAARLLVYGVQEVAVIGSGEEAAALLGVLAGGYFPNAVIARADGPQGAGAVPELLAHRDLVDGQPAAYVCRNFACQRPVTMPEALRAQLRGA
jgi:uncharacterized protein YyaL (SSP411 family)